MIVKCIAVPKERTPKKVEVILSKVPHSRKNVIKLNARIAEPYQDDYDEIFAFDAFDYEEEIGDNLDGIIPIDEYVSDEIAGDIPDDNEDEHAPSIYEIEADLEELENDLRSQLEESSPISDDSIVQRHFVRSDDGILYESDSETADGHEVACYDNTGKLKRACGVIRKGSPVIPVGETDALSEPEEDDIFSAAVSDMFLSN